MIAYEQNRQKLLQLFQTVIAFARERKNNDTVQYLAKVMQHLSEGQLYVVVCGEYKQGKSSFINALLNEKEDLCPVDVDVTTSVVTTIAYGEKEKFTAVLGEAGKETTENKILRRDQIKEYATEQGNPRNLRKARILAIQIPNEQLKSGLVLVDTPGVGGLNTEHTDVTYSFLPNADVALFVTDAHEPLSQLELDFIKERIDRHCPDIIFIVTKKDQNAQFQVIVDDNRRKLATKLNRTPDQITIIPVSSLLKRDYLEFQDEDALSASNFNALDTQLWKHLNDGRGRILQLKASIELGKSLADLVLPVEAELTALKEEDKQRLDEMEKKMQAMNKRLQDMLEKNPHWLNLLQDRLQDIHVRISDEFRQGFAEIKQQVYKYLDNRALRSKPEQIVNLLQADMGGLLAELQKSLEKDAATLQEVLGKETGLGLNPYRDVITSNVSIASPRQIDRTRVGLWSKGLEITRNATSTGGAGAALLGLLGGMVGGAIGLFAGGLGAIPGAYWGAMIGGALGQVSGMATGTRRTIQQMGQKDRAEIAQYLLNFVSEQEANLGSKLANAIRDMERFLRDDFTNQLTREKRSVEEAQASVRNARQMSQSESTARIDALVFQKRRLDYVQQELDKIMQSALETASGPSYQSGAQGGSGNDGITNESWADE